MTLDEMVANDVIEAIEKTGGSFEDIGGIKRIDTVTFGNLSLTRDDIQLMIGDQWLEEIEARYNDAVEENEASYLETLMCDGDD